MAPHPLHHCIDLYSPFRVSAYPYLAQYTLSSSSLGSKWFDSPLSPSVPYGIAYGHCLPPPRTRGTLFENSIDFVRSRRCFSSQLRLACTTGAHREGVTNQKALLPIFGLPTEDRSRARFPAFEVFRSLSHHPEPSGNSKVDPKLNIRHLALRYSTSRQPLDALVVTQLNFDHLPHCLFEELPQPFGGLASPFGGFASLRWRTCLTPLAEPSFGTIAPPRSTLTLFRLHCLDVSNY